MEDREKVPARYRKCAQTAALLDSIAVSTAETTALVKKLAAQFFIDTATWTLPLWEYQAGIVPPGGATADERRAAIKNRLLAEGNTNEETICTLARALTGREARVVNGGDYSFTLEFLGGEDGFFEMDLSQLRDAVELIKPAHLRFLIAGMTWQRLEAMAMTWQALEELEMTWRRMEAAAPIVKAE